MSSRFEQVFKFAERSRANHISLKTDHVIGRRLVFVKKHVEVIEPEIRHHFLQLCIGIDITRKSLRNNLFGHQPLRILQIQDHFLQVR